MALVAGAALALTLVVGAVIVLTHRGGDAVSEASQSLAVPDGTPSPGQPSDPATAETAPTPQQSSNAPSADPDGADQAASVAAFYDDYFSAINNGDYDTVWRMLSPRLRGQSPAALARGFASTHDSNVHVVSIAPKSKGRILAHVTFTSTQDAADGPDGDTCDTWDLNYLIAPSGDTWQIQHVAGFGNGPTHASC